MDLETFAKKYSKKASEIKNFLASENQSIAEKFKTSVEQITPVKTGFMKKSWQIQNPNSLEITILNKAKYSSFIDQGTKKIVPRRLIERANHTVNKTYNIEREIFK